MIKSGQYYKHFKTGNYYKVEMIALDVTNECEFDVVVYTEMNNSERYYTRELDQFLERFELQEQINKNETN